jgi:hypothetical protein
MRSPKKSSETETRPPVGVGSQEIGSSNGQSELRFSHAAFESGDMEIGGADFSNASRNEVPGASSDSGMPELPLSRGEVWMRRLSLAMFVVVCVWVGLILVVLPWTHAWTDNGLLLRNLGLRSFASLNFVRGVVSGLGLINVWMGIWEAVHYREPHKKAV